MFKDETDLEKIVARLNIDTAPNPEHRENLRQQMLALFSETKKQPQERTTPLGVLRKTIMKSRRTKLATAAVIIIGVFIGLHYLTGSIDGTNVAWGDVVKQISHFRPYICTCTVEDERSPARSYRLMRFSLTKRREIYSDGSIAVVDLAIPKRLTLYPEKKHAIELTYIGQPTSDFDLLRMVSSMQNQSSGEGGIQEWGVQKIEGHVAKGFRSLGKYNDITVWADVETKLPVCMEIIHVGMGTKIILSEFKFDVDLDESLFSTTAPEGYTVEKKQYELTNSLNLMRNATEADFIAGLRALAVFLDGEFPHEIEPGKLWTELKEYVERNNLSDSDVMERLRSVYEYWTKAYWYVISLKTEMGVSDFHYAGGGVKLGAGDKPIVWWLPKDSETYRVIYGDLRVEDVPPESLPQ
ncbi:MAG: hypothetical protein P8Z79_13240 [Sedimentisphaerales bacterium]|jgi:hypothetical protein